MMIWQTIQTNTSIRLKLYQPLQRMKHVLISTDISICHYYTHTHVCFREQSQFNDPLHKHRYTLCVILFYKTAAWDHTHTRRNQWARDNSSSEHVDTRHNTAAYKHTHTHTLQLSYLSGHYTQAVHDRTEATEALYPPLPVSPYACRPSSSAHSPVSQHRERERDRQGGGDGYKHDQKYGERREGWLLPWQQTAAALATVELLSWRLKDGITCGAVVPWRHRSKCRAPHSLKAWVCSKGEQDTGEDSAHPLEPRLQMSHSVVSAQNTTAKSSTQTTYLLSQPLSLCLSRLTHTHTHTHTNLPVHVCVFFLMTDSQTPSAHKTPEYLWKENTHRSDKSELSRELLMLDDEL